MVVKVEIWPGGDETRAQEIDRLYVGNLSSLYDVSDYVYRFSDRDWSDKGHNRYVIGHQRDMGAWRLVWRVLDQEHGL